jgi:hypothetical protein
LEINSLGNDPSEYLIINKNYGNVLKLKNPSNKFFNVALLWVQIFEATLYENPGQDNIASKIVLKCKNAMNSEEHQWYKEFCVEHSDKILRKFVTVSKKFFLNG